MKTPAQTENNVHKLPLNVVLTWWLGTSKIQIVFLTSLPIMTAFMIYYASAHAVPTLLMTVPVWLFMFTLLVLWLRVRSRHPLMVVRLQDGLELSAPFSKQKIAWSDIKEIVDISDYSYMLATRHGEFYLSKKLSGCQELIEAAKAHTPPPAVTYEFNTYTDEDSVFQIHTAASALAIALLYRLFHPMVDHSEVVLNTESVLAVLSLMTLNGFIWWLLVFKVPRLVRINSDGMYIRTCRQEKNYSWQQIERFRQLPRNTLVQTSDNWYLFMHDMMSHSNQVGPKLLECKKYLPKL